MDRDVVHTHTLTRTHTQSEINQELNELNQEFGIKTYTLLHVKQVTKKDLLYSTQKYTQYLVITYNEKESDQLPILYTVGLTYVLYHV